jgi:hypothetical protein
MPPTAYKNIQLSGGDGIFAMKIRGSRWFIGAGDPNAAGYTFRELALGDTFLDTTSADSLWRYDGAAWIATGGASAGVTTFLALTDTSIPGITTGDITAYDGANWTQLQQADWTVAGAATATTTCRFVHGVGDSSGFVVTEGVNNSQFVVGAAATLLTVTDTGTTNVGTLTVTSLTSQLKSFSTVLLGTDQADLLLTGGVAASTVLAVSARNYDFGFGTIIGAGAVDYVAIGVGASVSDTDCVAIGTGSQAKGLHSAAVGRGAIAEAQGAAFGIDFQGAGSGTASLGHTIAGFVAGTTGLHKVNGDAAAVSTNATATLDIEQKAGDEHQGLRLALSADGTIATSASLSTASVGCFAYGTDGGVDYLYIKFTGGWRRTVMSAF